MKYWPPSGTRIVHEFVHGIQRDRPGRARRRRLRTALRRRSTEMKCDGQRQSITGRDTRRMARNPRGRGFKSLPRYQGQRPFLEQRKGLLHVVCKLICARLPACEHVRESRVTVP
jgi:hypothetical protein